jgi:hypothetical protein
MTTSFPAFTTSSGSQLAAEILFGLAALVTVGYCANVSRRERAAWPMFVAVGAALTIFYEPFNNVLGHCGYPTDQHTLLHSLGRNIPWFIGFVYTFYFGIPVTWLVQRFDRGVTGRQLARYYAVAVVICAAFEPYFVHLNLWRYYGDNQALNMTGLPAFWWFANPMCVFAVATVVHLLRWHVLTRQAQSAIFMPLGVLTVFASHGSASIPVFMAVNGTTGRFWTTLATVATIGLSAMYMWLIARLVCIRVPAAPPQVRASAAPRVSEAVTAGGVR